MQICLKMRDVLVNKTKRTETETKDLFQNGKIKSHNSRTQLQEKVDFNKYYHHHFFSISIAILSM